MKHLISRRNFLRQTSGYVGGCWGIASLFGSTDGTKKSAAPAVGASTFAAPGNYRVAYYGTFSEMPVGAVRPRGWIKAWLQRQRTGLTGHAENMAYPYNSCMFAGKIPPPSFKHGEAWWPYEQSGYFLDAAVRLNHLMSDPTARNISQASLQYILDHSGPGKLGESVWNWPNTVVGRALMAEYDATANPKVAQVLMQCLQNLPVSSWRDSCLFEEAFYLYGLSADVRLLNYARKIYDLYFFSNPKSFSNIDKIYGKRPLSVHGVDAAEQLKLLPLTFSYTGDPQALELAQRAYHKIERDSRMADGGVVSAESLDATAFNSLHETCDITDWSWSIGYMLMADGSAHWGDWIEQMIFNALPGAVTKDFKQLQYFSSVNQVVASNTTCPTITSTRMSYRAAHDTECCAGNVNRAMPNYVTRMWMRMDSGLAATLFGPCAVSTHINGRPLQILEETDYPFSDTITFHIKVLQPMRFTLGLRIPKWCSNASVEVNGRRWPIDSPPGAFVSLKHEFCDGDVVVLHIPMGVEWREWFLGSGVSLQRGPLVYSLQPTEKRVEHTHDSDAIQQVLQGNNIQGFPAVEFFPLSEWRYGVEFTQQGKFPTFKVVESTMPDNPFLAATVPVRIEIPLRSLPYWATNCQPVNQTGSKEKSKHAKNPNSLPNSMERQARGECKTIALVPYGATHLRLTTFPKLEM